ncbi:hypothetical protein ACGLWX_08085 [Halomonas sp. HMF6819]|uniref:hypothetical protein n=1 Tax=Halomonas sp. HMF6819 TaxID=3373085 RepID=UPI0037AA6E49
MIEKMNRVNNPLTIIALFAAFAEVASTISLGLLDPSVQKIFVWFVMLFPVLIVSVFFLTLNFNNKVLYAPSDFNDEKNFLKFANYANFAKSNLALVEAKLDALKDELCRDYGSDIDVDEAEDGNSHSRLKWHLDKITEMLEFTRGASVEFEGSDEFKEAFNEISKTKSGVLDKFEKRQDDWSYAEFERALEEALGDVYGNYQTAKATIIEADRRGIWPKTVKRYVESNFKAFGNLPIELNPIGRRLNLFSE